MATSPKGGRSPFHLGRLLPDAMASVRRGVRGLSAV